MRRNVSNSFIGKNKRRHVANAKYRAYCKLQNVDFHFRMKILLWLFINYCSLAELKTLIGQEVLALAKLWSKILHSNLLLTTALRFNFILRSLQAVVHSASACERRHQLCGGHRKEEKCRLRWLWLYSLELRSVTWRWRCLWKVILWCSFLSVLVGLALNIAYLH